VSIFFRPFSFDAMYSTQIFVDETVSHIAPNKQAAVRLGMVGFVCGVAVALVLQSTVTADQSTFALATARPITALPFGLTPAMPAKPEALVLRSADPRVPLDPLKISGPNPEYEGPAKAVVAVASVLLAPILAVLWVYRKCAGPPAEDPMFDRRISMVAAVAELEETAVAPKAKKGTKLRKPQGSKRRRALEGLYQKRQPYPIDEALQLVKATATAKFTESVNVAVNLNIDPRKAEQMVRGSIVLPEGTGKVVRVAAFCQGEALEKAKAAGAEFFGLQDLADLIKGGELGFDVVVATPDSMRVALQLGKILGPRGLMPNPKDGTVNPNIEEAIKNAKAGQVKYRADKAGTVHCSIGKSNFELSRLRTNLIALLRELMKVKPPSVKGIYMNKVVVSASMGPGIYVDPTTAGLA